LSRALAGLEEGSVTAAAISGKANWATWWGVICCKKEEEDDDDEEEDAGAGMTKAPGHSGEARGCGKSKNKSNNGRTCVDASVITASLSSFDNDYTNPRRWPMKGEEQCSPNQRERKETHPDFSCSSFIIKGPWRQPQCAPEKRRSNGHCHAALPRWLAGGWDVWHGFGMQPSLKPTGTRTRYATIVGQSFVHSWSVQQPTGVLHVLLGANKLITALLASHEDDDDEGPIL
jgi:hypothetical protein